MMQKLKNAKPFLKWAGGKGQLLQTFENFFPEDLKTGKIENYYEPFVGGGAVFFHIIQNYPIKNAYLYDVSNDLIVAYSVIKNDSDKLIDQLQDIEVKYLKNDDEKRKEFFYSMRKEFNEQVLDFNYKRYSSKWINRATLLIFLNRTCFNGLVRFNSKGEFNTPVGRYKNPVICNKDNLVSVSKTLQNTNIKQSDFSAVCDDIKPNSFVYFDPPYRPLKRSSSFTAYSKQGFNDVHQNHLASVFADLHEKNVKLMLSNSDPKNENVDDDFFEELYKSFHICRVKANRKINSNSLKRGKLKEIIVTNYPVENVT